MRTPSNKKISAPANRRKIRNYLLLPALQLKISVAQILLATIFTASLLAIFYVHLNAFFTIVIQMTNTDDSQLESLLSGLATLRISLMIAGMAFVAAQMLMVITYSHRLIGPMVAIKRTAGLLASGKYGYQVKLRPHDAFKEVADDLNRLSRRLESIGHQTR